MKIAIVGGGISGLAAAYFLRRHKPVVFEASGRLGGVISTERDRGFLIEGGPDSFVAGKPAARELCDELGLPVIPTKQRGAYLYDGALRPLSMEMPREAPREGETVADYARRCGTPDFADLVAGIYMTEPDRLGATACLPLGGGGFVAPRDGMQSLVDALTPERVEFRAVESLDIADVVILATPAPVTAKLLGIENPTAYVESTVVALGYENVALPEGTGFIARGRRISACTFSSNKFEGRAPPGGALVRVFFRGDGDAATAREDLRVIVDAEPAVVRVFRHRGPVYGVGHRAPPAPPNVHLIGAAWRGVGIPDCIAGAFDVARRIG